MRMRAARPSMSPAARKRLGVFVVCVVAMLLVAARIAWVNTRALTYPTAHHPMGEWVELDGAFIYERDSESTDDYSLRVDSAELLSYNEYVERYGDDPSKLQPENAAYNTKSILCLNVDLRNQGKDGQFFIGEAKVLPAGAIKALRLDRQLWMESNKNIDEALMYISVYPNTEFTLHIPFITNAVAYTDTQGRYAQDLDVGDASFVVSTAPVRHIIDLKV